jgi:2-keto-4-pentenoate hydratase
LNAVVWLANRARDVGDPLRAGEIVLSGALGPMHSVAAGESVRADLTGLGTVSVEFVGTAR